MINRLAKAASLALLALLSTGCATMYVDNGLKDVAKSDFMAPPEPRPVQLLFAFQTKGAANARATKQLSDEVTKTVMESGLFSAVGTQPVEGGTLLSVTINNIPVTDDAFSKGFVTGLTFGLAGSQVTDGYLCTIDYQPAVGRGKLQKKVRHAIHTTVGAKKAPTNGVKAKSIMEAVYTMTHQIVGNGLKELSLDPSFLQ
jgi:hypothetical protein